MNTGLSAIAESASGVLERQLAEFRAGHAPRHVSRGGLEWTYYAGGSGDQTILRLTGALGVAEFAFQQARLLEPRVRVLTPDYPAVGSLPEMVDGLVAILDAEGVQHAHVSGGSFGGLLAQVLVRKAPERVASLILSHTGAPDGRRRRAALALVSAMPIGVLRRLLKARLGRTLDAADPFWQRYFARAISEMAKADIVSRIRLQAEFGEARWSPDDLARWPGRVLLIEGDDDPLFPAAARERVRALYPTAQVYRFRGTGHAAAVLRPEEYCEVVTKFVLGEGAGGEGSVVRG